MGGLGPAILCFRTPFLFTFPRFLQVPILELGRLWLSLQSHATDPRPKLKNRVHRDSNPRPLRQRIPNPLYERLPAWKEASHASRMGREDDKTKDLKEREGNFEKIVVKKESAEMC